MATYVVGYDLHKPGQDYSSLFTALKAYSNWCHPLDSAWFIVSNQTPENIRNTLTQHIDKNDSLFVGRVQAPAAWFGFSDEITNWLKANL